MTDKCNIFTSCSTILISLKINKTRSANSFLFKGLPFTVLALQLKTILSLLTERRLPQSCASSLPNVLDGVVALGRDGHEDGLRSVLEQRCSVLSLSLLHPVAVYLEGARIDELTDGLDGIRVTLKHLLGDGFCASVVAVDPHGGQDSHADDLSKEFEG